MTIRDPIIHTGLHRPCGRFVPLRGTGRVDTRPYKAGGVVGGRVDTRPYKALRRPGVRPPYGSVSYCLLPIA